MLGVAGNAEARADIDGLVVERQRRFQRLQDLAGHALRRVEVGRRQQHREFVAAQARHLRRRLQAVNEQQLQAASDLAQQRVAEAVTHHVVHMLEAVEVHHQHEHGLLAAARIKQCVIEQQQELRAVGQVGQRVPVRQAADFLFALGDRFAHRVERAGQRADFVGAAGVDVALVVALLEAAGGGGQLADRLGDALGGDHDGNHGYGDAAQREQDQPVLEAAVFGGGFVDRTGQDHAGELAVVLADAQQARAVAVFFHVQVERCAARRQFSRQRLQLRGHGLRRRRQEGGSGW